MNHRESMEEDDMVKSKVGNTLVRRRTDGGGRAASPRDLIRRCQKIPYNYIIIDFIALSLTL